MANCLDGLVEAVGGGDARVQAAAGQHLPDAIVDRLALLRGVAGELACRIYPTEAQAARRQQLRGHVAGLTAQGAIVDKSALLGEAGLPGGR